MVFALVRGFGRDAFELPAGNSRQHPYVGTCVVQVDARQLASGTVSDYGFQERGGVVARPYLLMTRSLLVSNVASR